MTRKILYAFENDQANPLAKVADAEGKETTIIRDPQAGTIVLQSPFGQATTLWLGQGGYVQTIQGPDGETVQLAYTAPESGLLESLTDQRGNETTFVYDDNGRLLSDNAPGGGSKTLITNADDPAHKSVSVVTAQGRTTTYEIDTSDPKVTVRKVTGPDGLATTSARAKLATPVAGGPVPGQVTTTSPDGTTVT